MVVVCFFDVGLCKWVLSVLVFLILLGGLVVLGWTFLTEVFEDWSEWVLWFVFLVVEDLGDGWLGLVFGGLLVVESVLVVMVDFLVVVLRGGGELVGRIWLDVFEREMFVVFGFVMGTVFEHVGG